MSKYTVVVALDHFGTEYQEIEFDDREAVFNFVTLLDTPCTILHDGIADDPRSDEAWDDWLVRKD